MGPTDISVRGRSKWILANTFQKNHARIRDIVITHVQRSEVYKTCDMKPQKVEFNTSVANHVSEQVYRPTSQDPKCPVPIFLATIRPMQQELRTYQVFLLGAVSHLDGI